MDLLITIAALLLLLGADREREAAFEPALRTNNNVEQKWRAIRRILSDTWVRCRAVAAGQEAIQ